jgi:bacterioferritin-associated ferredoxin
VLICHCRSVNDRAIRAAIAAGARHPTDVADGCGAGSRCGGCLPALLELLEQGVEKGVAGAELERHTTAA